MLSAILYVNGQAMPLGTQSLPPLARAIVISLFTWRQANADDALPSNERMGWWGDSVAAQSGDLIGSRLWLLSRAKVTQDTLAKAKEYAQEALQWLVDDAVAARVDVQSERVGVYGVGLQCQVYKADGSVAADVRFANVWDFLNV